MAHDGKKEIFCFLGCTCTQGQKVALSLKRMTHKLVKWCVFNMYLLDPCCYCGIWALRVSSFTCTKINPFLLLLVKSFKYDKLKPILNSETLIWLRLKERESFCIKKLKTLTPYGLNQEPHWYHVMEYPYPQCLLYLFLSAYGLKIWLSLTFWVKGNSPHFGFAIRELPSDLS